MAFWDSFGTPIEATKFQFHAYCSRQITVHRV